MGAGRPLPRVPVGFGMAGGDGGGAGPAGRAADSRQTRVAPFKGRNSRSIQVRRKLRRQEVRGAGRPAAFSTAGPFRIASGFVALTRLDSPPCYGWVEFTTTPAIGGYADVGFREPQHIASHIAFSDKGHPALLRPYCAPGRAGRCSSGRRVRKSFITSIATQISCTSTAAPGPSHRRLPLCCPFPAPDSCPSRQLFARSC